MDTALNAAVIWSDADVVELRISAWNGRFGGLADVYVATDGLSKAAAQIAGFPTTTSDTRELQFGDFGRHSAGGGARLRFYVQGGAGHTFVDVQIEADYNRSEAADSVSFRAPVEASSVDIFVHQLQEVEARGTGTARLRLGSRE